MEKQNFDSFLREFNGLVDNTPTVGTIRSKLENLKERAQNEKTMTFRQTDAILARCDNYLNGTYGKTKTDKNLSYSGDSK